MKTESHPLDLVDLTVETFDTTPLSGVDANLMAAGGPSAATECRHCFTAREVCGTGTF